MLDETCEDSVTGVVYAAPAFWVNYNGVVPEPRGK
jgi:hypothetical protein